MNAFKKFNSASNEAGDSGAIIEIEANGQKMFIPLANFNADNGFQIRLWTAQQGECAIGFNLAGSASSKDIAKIYRDSLPKPFCHKVSQ